MWVHKIDLSKRLKLIILKINRSIRKKSEFPIISKCTFSQVSITNYISKNKKNKSFTLFWNILLLIWVHTALNLIHKLSVPRSQQFKFFFIHNGMYKEIFGVIWTLTVLLYWFLAFVDILITFVYFNSMGCFLFLITWM